jgi:hypothetical protein
LKNFLRIPLAFFSSSSKQQQQQQQQRMSAHTRSSFFEADFVVVVFSHFWVEIYKNNALLRLFIFLLMNFFIFYLTSKKKDFRFISSRIFDKRKTKFKLKVI